MIHTKESSCQNSTEGGSHCISIS